MIYKQVVPESKEVYAVYEKGDKRRVVAWAVYDSDEDEELETLVEGLVIAGAGINQYARGST